MHIAKCLNMLITRNKTSWLFNAWKLAFYHKVNSSWSVKQLDKCSHPCFDEGPPYGINMEA